jgi:hypothetical protein
VNIRNRHLLRLFLLCAAPAAAHADEVELGLDPSRPRGDSNLQPTDEEDEGDEDDGYRFAFHGFLRVPMRVGVGGDGELHAPPRIPDGAYTDWRYTNVSGGPWTELWLQYGNGTVSANVVLAAYDISDASYRDLLSQLGISQSFISFDLPELFGDDGGVVWNVGAFSNRYGTAAQYDAGKYDTYLFGATHVAGETVSAHYEVTPDLTVAVDHGIGAKLQVAPQVPGLEAPYLPYPGDEQQGSTLLHHAHAGIGTGELTAAAHYLTAWTVDQEPGRITNVGVDLKLIGHELGDGYLGWSHLTADHAVSVAGAFEVLHSFEGWNLRDNYFPDTDGTGTIDTLMFQYSFSLARYLWAPQEFWGQGPDLVFSGFGMYNRIASDAAGFTGPTGRLKVGGQATYSPRGWVGLDLRYDLVQPDMANADKSFQVISPSVVLRSEFASHEEVVIGYSRYLNGIGVAPGYPHELLAPDRQLFRISAVMWW